MKDKRKLIKYLATGGISFVVEYSLFLIIVYVFSSEAWLGQAISYSLTIVVNFLLLRNWAFDQSKGGKLPGHMAKYGLLIAFNLPMTTLLVFLLTSINIPAFFAKLIVIALTTIWNFIIYDKIVFRENIRRGM